MFNKLKNLWANEKPALITLIILIVTSMAILVPAYTYNSKQDKKTKEKVELLTEIVDSTTQQLDDIHQQESRIADMAKACRVAFGLSTYEAKYWSRIFYDFSREYNIPWEIYPSIIKVESNFDPTAKSNKNAFNLTQVINPTAESIAKEIGIKYTAKTKWHDLHMMIIGFTYFSKNVKKHDLTRALRIYNGGPNHKKASAQNKAKHNRYVTKTMNQFYKLSYIYKGVRCDTKGIDPK